ncbi:MAG: hypothetical protein ACRER1_02275, partial [Gammaproteobacteria bacterium]
QRVEIGIQGVRKAASKSAFRRYSYNYQAQFKNPRPAHIDQTFLSFMEFLAEQIFGISDLFPSRHSGRAPARSGISPKQCNTA